MKRDKYVRWGLYVLVVLFLVLGWFKGIHAFLDTKGFLALDFYEGRGATFLGKSADLAGFGVLFTLVILGSLFITELLSRRQNETLTKLFLYVTVVLSGLLFLALRAIIAAN